MDTVTAKAQEIATLALPLLEAVKAATITLDTTLTVTGILFNCPDGQRKEFIQEWAKDVEVEDELLDLEGFDSSILLVVSLGNCGGEGIYRTADDIPLVDVPCPCGDPNHWLIKWEEELTLKWIPT